MGLRLGSWKTVTITEDDDPAVSSEVDLGAVFRNVQVYSPAIDSASLMVMPSRNTGDTAVAPYFFSQAATGDLVITTTAKTVAAMEVFKDICARFVTLLLNNTQGTADRTFYIRGIDPL